MKVAGGHLFGTAEHLTGRQISNNHKYSTVLQHHEKFPCRQNMTLFLKKKNVTETRYISAFGYTVLAIVGQPVLTRFL